MRKLISLLLSVIISFTAVGQEFSKTQIPYIPTNYIFNSGIENGLTGYGVYNDGDVAIPVDGIGGTATVSVATTTTLPLVGGRSLVFTKPAGTSHRGQGLNVKDFRIDDQAKGKVIRTSLDYEITSGTYATGDLAVWIYDVTNARWIQPSAYSIENSLLKETKFVEWQSSIDSNLYRLVVHVTSTSTSGYTVKFDSFGAGLGPKIYGSVTTDWVSYTPAPSITTNATHSGRWRKVGDKVEVSAKTAFSGANTQGNLTMALPSGMSVDTTKIISGGQNLGVGLIYDASADVYYDTQVFVLGTTIYMTRGQVASPPFARTDLNTPITIASGDEVYWNFSVPILGWSSSQQLSQDADTRVVAATMSGGFTPIPSGSDTVYIPVTVEGDSHGAYNSSTGIYTVKVSGDYVVGSKYTYNTFALSSGGTIRTGVKVNGVLVKYIYDHVIPSSLTTTHTAQWGSVTLKNLKAGDTISITAFQNSGSTQTISNDTARSFVTIEKISGPSQIAASETVVARYTQSSGQSIPNNTDTILLYGTKVEDSHNSYNTSTGVFTSPDNRQYSVCASATFQQNATSRRYMQIRKNGLNYEIIYSIMQIGGFVHQLRGCALVRLLRGETLDVRVNQDSGASLSMYTENQYTTLNIYSVGL